MSVPTVLTFGEALVGYGSTESGLRTATQFTRFPGGADPVGALVTTRRGDLAAMPSRAEVDQLLTTTAPAPSTTR